MKIKRFQCCFKIISIIQTFAMSWVWLADDADEVVDESCVDSGEATPTRNLVSNMSSLGAVCLG